MTWVVSVLQWLDGMALMVAILGGIIGAIWALYQLGQKVNRAMRRQDKIDRLLAREFADDGNGSLKSQVNKTSGRLELVDEKLNVASAERTLMREMFENHIDNLSLHAHDPEAHRRDDGTEDAGPAGPR